MKTDDSFEELLVRYQADETVPAEFKQRDIYEMRGFARSFDEMTKLSVIFFAAGTLAAEYNKPWVTGISFLFGAATGLYAYIAGKIHDEFTDMLQKYKTPGNHPR